MKHLYHLTAITVLSYASRRKKGSMRFRAIIVISLDLCNSIQNIRRSDHVLLSLQIERTNKKETHFKNLRDADGIPKINVIFLIDFIYCLT